MGKDVVWKDKNTFTVKHPESGREQDVIIPGADKLDPQRLENLVAWQTEETLEELRGPETSVAGKPHSKDFQHELGRQLKAIEESKRRVKETGHGKYW